MDFNKIRSSVSLQKDGVWYEPEDIAPWLNLSVEEVGGARLKLAYSQNRSIKRKMRSRAAKAMLGRDQADIDQEEMVDQVFGDESMIPVLASDVIKGWENWELDGKPIEYSVENAERMLLASTDFLELVENLAAQQDKYRGEQLERIEKN